jgi:pilus assembly protein Flp/PilA
MFLIRAPRVALLKMRFSLVAKPLVSRNQPTVARANFMEALMQHFLGRLWSEEQGQDIAEYAVMLAVILVIVIGTVQLIGSNANTVFSNVASSIQ